MDETTEKLAPGLSVEDTGDAFFVIIKGAGHDITISLDNDVAIRLAQFISSRRLHPPV